jgi:hypothetical protein
LNESAGKARKGEPMNSLITSIAPTATNLIRADHTHVLATFHKYYPDSAPSVKEGLVGTICTALEIHAQIEEEIFYPAMRAVNPAIVEKSVPEHDEMRRLISALREMDASHPGYDSTVMELMRDVMHHVADEETTMLPEAERLLGGELSELGAQMTKRRIELGAPRAGEMALNAVRAMPAAAVLVGAGALLAGGYLLKHTFRR